mgnify:CR=1 FL=1
MHELRGKAWAFPRCLASHVSGPEDEVALARELRLRLGEKDAARLLTAPNRPLQALADLSYCMVSFARFFFLERTVRFVLRAFRSLAFSRVPSLTTHAVHSHSPL